MNDKAEKPRNWLDSLNLLALKTLVGIGAFVLTVLASVFLIATNAKVSDGLTFFASVVFGAILGVLGVSGWQSIMRRKTEWEPSQEAKDTIQLNRHLDANKPIISPATAEHPTPTVLAPVQQKPPAPPKPTPVDKIPDVPGAGD